MGTMFWVLIGAFVGWNFPQPWWARYIQEKVVAKFTNQEK